MIYKYEDIDTPEFFKKWKEEEKEQKQIKEEKYFWLKLIGKFSLTMIVLFAIWAMIAIIEII